MSGAGIDAKACRIHVGITAAVGTLLPANDRGQVIAQNHGYSAADVENGARLYQSSCAGCHGPAGDEIPGVELARGQFRRGTSDTDLIASPAGSVLFVYALRQ